MDRRNFLTTLGAGATLAAVTPSAFGRTPKKERPKGFAWAYLIHFGHNMWGDWDGTVFEAPEAEQMSAAERAKYLASRKKSGPKDYLRFDYETWKTVTGRMAEDGLNMILIDMGEAVTLPSHPELAVKGSWEVDRFRKELDRLRALGLEPIPKFNFSAGHDAWLKEYGHMMGEKKWYDVTADIIRDTCEIFGGPRYFHIGYEEEFGDKYERPDDLWWHDLYHLVGAVEKAGARAWAWTDYPAWRPRETFLKKMPKSVLQSAWWYAQFQDLMRCPDPRKFIKAGLFADLEKMGFDQIPCGGNWSTDKNMAEVVACGDAVIAPTRLKGYLTAPWKATVPEYAERLCAAADQLGAEI